MGMEFNTDYADINKYLKDNIAMTRKVLEIARPIGVSVEAELGKIVGTEDHVHVEQRDAMYTDQILGPSAGSCHRNYPTKDEGLRKHK